jgi:hypothetical protein
VAPYLKGVGVGVEAEVARHLDSKKKPLPNGADYTAKMAERKKLFKE